MITVVVLLREIGVTVLRAVVIRHPVVPASSQAQDVLQTIALTLLVAPLPGPLDVVSWVVMALAVGVTVVTGVQCTVSILRAARRHRAGAAGQMRTDDLAAEVVRRLGADGSTLGVAGR